MHPIRLAIADDHGLFRTALKEMLSREPDIDIVSECTNGEEALNFAREHKPQVLLLDIQMPRMSGLEVTRRLTASKCPTRILVLSMFNERPFPRLMMQVGASGFLSKDCARDELIRAIRAVANGKRYVQGELAASMTADAGNPFEQITARELDVCLAVLKGIKPKEVARQLSLSEKTVSSYRMRLFEKLEVESEADLIRLAMAHGLHPFPDSGDASAT
jgi:DNA-binding NarL/FixJ family response regulator